MRGDIDHTCRVCNTILRQRGLFNNLCEKGLIFGC